MTTATTVKHDPTIIEKRSPSGTVYWLVECPCGHHYKLHLSRIQAAQDAGDHVRVAQQLLDLQAQQTTITGEEPA